MTILGILPALVFGVVVIFQIGYENHLIYDNPLISLPLSLISLSPIFIISGIILAIISLSQIKKYKLKGKGYAWAAIIMDILYIIIMMISLAILLYQTRDLFMMIFPFL